jgi:diguanylate cyclase
MKKVLGQNFSAAEVESVSARITVDLLCYLTTPILIFFGVKSYFDGMHIYGLSLLGFAGIIGLSHFAYKVFGRWEAHKNFLMLCYSVLYFYLLITGGEESTGIYWLFAYPLLIFSIHGLQAGVLILASILSVSGIILFVPNWLGIEVPYNMNTKLRFGGSMVFVTIMAYSMERARVQATKAHLAASAMLEDLACTDELTGMLNRRGIKERISSELARSQRHKQELSIVLCDVDFFKRINDNYGHDAGDEALRKLAKQLNLTIRESDVVGRWGGEEFILLLPNTSIEKAYLLVERIRMRIASEPLALNGRSIKLSISCGLSSTKFSSDLSSLLKCADLSLYEAKEQGRNCTRPVMLEAI